MNSTNTALFDDKLNREKTYWLDKFAGEPRAAGIPLDRNRPAVFNPERSSLTIQIDPETEARLREICGDREALMFTVLVTVLKICLHKYTGETDIIIGTAIHERFAEVASLNKVLALRDEVRPDQTVKQLLHAVKGTLSDAYANQKYPFERLVKVLNVENANNRAPLFNVVAIQDATNNKENVRHLMSDATLVYSLGSGPVVCTIQYNPDLFEPETIEIFGRHLQRILQAVLHDTDAEVSQLELLSGAERQQQLVEFNETQQEYRKHETICRLFEEQVEQTPEHIAVTVGKHHITYQALNVRANRLAHKLREEGIKPGALAGICLEHSIETLVAILGVLKAGGAYVPLDPRHPQARMASVLADAGCAVLLTQESLLDVLPDNDAKVICLDSEWEIIAQESAENPAVEISAGDLAYVIYTSGSTGAPKGVAVNHRSLVNYTQWASEVYVQHETLAFPLYSSLSFDLTVTSIFTPLITGNRIIVYRQEGRESALFNILRDNEVGVLKLTPSHLALIKDDDHGASRIKRLIVGGEAFDTETARQVHESFGGAVEILNEYGPTEATVGCMLYKYDPESDRRAFVPIGKPAANTQIYILDENLKPVAENVLGELYISGAGLATGYLNRHDLTIARFIDNPFREGEKMYRSGDVARRLTGGDIEYIGRKDEQVKFHGYRVELNEIRSALNRHAQVRDSVVRLQRDAGGNDALVAYYVARQEVEPQQLREHLSEYILTETIPSFFIHLKRLPLTLNGKINHALLPSLDDIKSQNRAEYVAPRTEVEEIVAGIWATLLGVPQVGRYDNFFQLGGHSLLATRVVSRVRDTFHVELTVRSLFEHPTVNQLATDIETLIRNGLGEQIPLVKRADSDAESAPLSFAQQRLWFIDQLVPGGTFYNVSSAVRLQGRLDISALERTITEVTRRHEVLRTTFQMVDGEPAQVIAPVQPFALPVKDLSALTEQQQEEELGRLLSDFSAQPFNLSQDSLLRVGLVRLGEDSHAVMLGTHHIISDGWSMSVLVKEVAAIYEAFSRGEPSPLPELAIQYADFAVWQREWLRGEALERELSYWRKQLNGAPPVLELPTDRPRPAVQAYRGASHSFHVSAEVSAGLKALSRSEGATLFMTLLAAFKVLLSRYSGQTDIVVGTPIAGRNRVELEPLIGFFVNTLALRTRLSSALNFREVLQQVRETALEAYAHENLPFEKIVEELNPERALSHTPLVQVVFGFQSLLEQEATNVSDLTMKSFGNESGTARFDVVQNMFETEKGLSGSLHCNTDLFDLETIKQMSEHFQRLLHSIVEHPDVAISELALLSAEERAQQLVEWNDTAVSYARDLTLHERFEAQAAATPEAIALVYEAEQLSYRELNERANQLAHYLRELGVGPETLVGLCCERSIELVVALLGVLKAGGAYLPLDPQYPHERLAFMVQDAGISLLLTQTHLDGSEQWAGAQTRVIALEQEWADISQRSVANPAVTVTADNLAYVIYTSGSSGQPKGTLITHYNVMRLLDATAERFAFSGKDVWTLFHSYAFDFSVWEIWGALAYGGQLVVVPYGLSRSPAEFYQLLRREGVTVLNQTPSAFRQLSAVDAAASEAERAELALRLVIFGGEALEWQSLRGWFERHGEEQPQLVNMYGITETTVHVTERAVNLSGLAEASAGSLIGKALADLQLYLLDQQMELLPVGVWGELYVGGAGLARGYLKRAELTAQRFVPNPFAGSGERLYRTGDVGRYRADGEIEYLGRADSQVKLRGFRIELGEIESVLGAYAGVREVVVTVREDVPGEQRVVAYLVGEALDSSELRAYVKEKLPDYMVPAAFVTLTEMPLTQNGKVDRRALPAPDAARPEASLRAPNSPLERWLAERWCEVLHLEAIGIDEDFFDLGGDSIKAAIVINRLQQELGEIIHVVTIFDAPSVARFASYLEGQYPEAVQRLFGVSVLERTAVERGPVTVDQVEQLRALTAAARGDLRQLAGKPAWTRAAGMQPALFVLSAPRSGSTLMRVMLGGHSRLFAPPELELLGYETMGQRRQALSGRDQFWLEGAIRAVMQALDCTAEQAQTIIGEYEAGNATTTEFYRDLQEWIGVDRMLVDKTPSYAMELEVLRRAEQEFGEQAHYIHLVRRPEAVIHSYEEAHLEQIFPRFAHPFSGREVAELVWVISQQNILEFLGEVSAERQHRVVFEELVAEPQRVLEGVSEFLGLEYEAGMSEPYRERAERMTDGVRAESKMLGDIKFHEHRGIEAGVGERWRQTAGSLQIAEVTSELAKSLGYVAQAEANNLPTVGAKAKSLTPIRRVDEKANDEQIAADISVMSDQEVEAMLESVLV
jgi:amino acid adenylation domain-containing protein